MVQTRAAKASALSFAIGDLEEICRSSDSDELSLDSLKKLVEEQPELVSSQFYLKDSYFLLGACENKHITLEVIQYLLKTFPGASSVAMDETEHMTGKCLTHALHLACMNANCPDEVLVELINDAPVALSNFTLIGEGLTNLGEDYHHEPPCPDEVPGLPLHYYLARESNISVNMLEKLVAAYPESIGASPPASNMSDEGVTPIHVLLSNPNVGGMMDILQHLIETHPSIFRKTSGKGKTSPLHIAVQNKRIDASIVRLLIDAWPESLRLRCWNYFDETQTYLPIHVFIVTNDIHLVRRIDSDDARLIEILKLLIMKDPDLVQTPDQCGNLPLHIAVGHQSTEFCKVLVDAYPESVRISTPDNGYAGSLPIHSAAEGRTKCAVETVQYLIECYPESLRSEDTYGYTPLHSAVDAVWRFNTEVIKSLLTHDPSLAKVQSGGEDYFGHNRLKLPLHCACSKTMYHSVEIVKLLFNAYPEGIFDKSFSVDGRGEISRHTPLESAYHSIRQHQSTYRHSSNSNEEEDENGNSITCFLETQLEYARMAKNHEAMTTPDNNGRLALHKALLEGAPHGSIKFLLKGYPAALQVADNNGKLPLHLACKYGSVDTVKLFIESSNDEVLGIQDGSNNYPLHLACLGSNYEVVQFLLGRGTAAVSKLNGDGKQPLTPSTM